MCVYVKKAPQIGGRLLRGPEINQFLVGKKASKAKKNIYSIENKMIKKSRWQTKFFPFFVLSKSDYIFQVCICAFHVCMYVC